MNKGELIEALAKETGESKRNAEDFLNAFIDTVTTQVKNGERVQLPGFGTFERRARSARTARNPPHRRRDQDQGHAGSRVQGWCRLQVHRRRQVIAGPLFEGQT